MVKKFYGLVGGIFVADSLTELKETPMCDLRILSSWIGVSARTHAVACMQAFEYTSEGKPSLLADSHVTRDLHFSTQEDVRRSAGAVLILGHSRVPHDMAALIWPKYAATLGCIAKWQKHTYADFHTNLQQVGHLVDPVGEFLKHLVPTAPQRDSLTINSMRSLYGRITPISDPMEALLDLVSVL